MERRGRPTLDPKPLTLRARVSADDLRRLDAVAAHYGSDRSTTVRGLITVAHQKLPARKSS